MSYYEASLMDDDYPGLWVCPHCDGTIHTFAGEGEVEKAEAGLADLQQWVLAELALGSRTETPFGVGYDAALEQVRDRLAALLPPVEGSEPPTPAETELERLRQNPADCPRCGRLTRRASGHDDEFDLVTEWWCDGCGWYVQEED